MAVAELARELGVTPSAVLLAALDL
jgi:hypothetical protein